MALGPAHEGTPGDRHPLSRGSPNGGFSGIMGSQQGLAWKLTGSHMARALPCRGKGTRHPGPEPSRTVWQRCPMPRILKEPEGWALSILR